LLYPKPYATGFDAFLQHRKKLLYYSRAWHRCKWPSTSSTRWSGYWL